MSILVDKCTIGERNHVFNISTLSAHHRGLPDCKMTNS